MDRMSLLLDKLRVKYENLKPLSTDIKLQTSLPSISVTCDMGLTPGPPEVTFKDNILVIHSKGVSMESFPFMTQEVETQMRQLVSHAKQLTTKCKIGAEVAQKFEYGKNTLPDFTPWE